MGYNFKITNMNTCHDKIIYFFLQIQQNTSLELAKAIRELEASTAALTSAYDSETMVSESKTSLPSSSGYGTMNSTPASSQDPLTSGGKSLHYSTH